MQINQRMIQTQKLILNQSLQQSLQCLQMSVQELSDYIQEAALSNPLLEVEAPPLGSPFPERSAAPVEVREQSVWAADKHTTVQEDPADFTAMFTRPPSFSEHLNAQLGQMKMLEGDFLALCRFLVGCLNSSGYLDCSLSELADEVGCSLFDMEQALFVIQALDPVGVGARSLSECLLLQLAQSRYFNELNIHMVQTGLPLLAAGDYSGLSKLLNVRLAEVMESAKVIRKLNPIPSRGFDSGSTTAYIIPEAVIHREGGALTLELNDRALPRVSLNEEYRAMVGRDDCADAQSYLREKMSEAKSLIANVQSRSDTLLRLLTAVTRMQSGYFLHGQPLQPMTMKQLAEELDLNTSTVSRTVKDKYIQFEGRVLPLRSLFTVSLQTVGGDVVSAETARQQIQRFVAAEDPARPLSDEALGQALAGVGILLSRRTVSKYRGELGIPAAGARKRGQTRR